MKLRKKKTCDGDWIVANDRYNTHVHFDSEFGASCMIYFLRNNIEPEDDYFIAPKRRLTEEPKISKKKQRKKRKKDRYYNKG